MEKVFLSGELMDQNGIWLTIVEYSKYRDISISTVRRYIKSKRVVFKKETGRFFIHVTLENFQKRKSTKEISLNEKLKIQKIKLKKLEEENNDLKMLVSIYESNQKPFNALPELPTL